MLITLVSITVEVEGREGMRGKEEEVDRQVFWLT